MAQSQTQPKDFDVTVLLTSCGYHLYSIWLFTLSDIKTIILPSLAFALFTAPSLPAFGITPAPPWLELLQRVPRVLFWLWINLLPFTIDNQRQPQAVAEDLLNKPWRTMPSKRMRPDQARLLMLCLYPLALVTSLWVGGIKQCLTLMVLGYWYNDGKGADQNFAIRNFINACGFTSFTSGAVEVLLGHDYPPTSRLVQWFLVIGSVVFTTVQTQDMSDQLGDSIRGRRTVPLVIGDGLGRWSIALPMAFWCCFCPWFWRAPTLGYMLCMGLGGLTIARCLTLRTELADKLTFAMWNLWLVVLYCLPLLKFIYA